MYILCMSSIARSIARSGVPCGGQRLTYPHILNISISLLLLFYVINIHLGYHKKLFWIPNDDVSEASRPIKGAAFATIPPKINNFSQKST